MLVLSWINCERGLKRHEFSGIVVSAGANQYSTKLQSTFWSVIWNSRCSYPGSRPFWGLYYLAVHCGTDTQSCRRSFPRLLWLPVHHHIKDIRSPSKSSTWILILGKIQRSIGCSCSLDIYVLLWLLCFIDSRVPLYIATRGIEAYEMSSDALKSLIIKSAWFPTRLFCFAMNSGFEYN